MNYFRWGSNVIENDLSDLSPDLNSKTIGPSAKDLRARHSDTSAVLTVNRCTDEEDFSFSYRGATGRNFLEQLFHFTDDGDDPKLPVSITCNQIIIDVEMVSRYHDNSWDLTGVPDGDCEPRPPEQFTMKCTITAMAEDWNVDTVTFNSKPSVDSSFSYTRQVGAVIAVNGILRSRAMFVLEKIPDPCFGVHVRMESLDGSPMRTNVDRQLEWVRLPSGVYPPTAEE